MESMSTLGIAAHGYGIRYEHGCSARRWSMAGSRSRPKTGWISATPGSSSGRSGVPDQLRRQRRNRAGWHGKQRQVWWPGETVRAVAYDTPVVGWRGASVNTLRLWRARALEELHLERFNAGDHLGAVAEVARAESISRVLYPADSTEAGQELRLRQEYFFVSASLQDLLRRHLNMHTTCSTCRCAAIQLNDTHPSIAVAELMRQLVDQHECPGTPPGR
jgi:starch phosphorylase